MYVTTAGRRENLYVPDPDRYLVSELRSGTLMSSVLGFPVLLIFRVDEDSEGC